MWMKPTPDTCLLDLFPESHHELESRETHFLTQEPACFLAEPLGPLSLCILVLQQSLGAEGLLEAGHQYLGGKIGGVLLWR